MVVDLGREPPQLGPSAQIGLDLAEHRPGAACVGECQVGPRSSKRVWTAKYGSA
jgi:hypothetical protein